VFQRTVVAPGELAPVAPFDPTVCLAGLPGFQRLDSLAVDGAGNVCVATLGNGGITVIAPDGEVLEHLPTGDPLTTNICFGGSDLSTAFITLSGTGRLVSTTWRWPGLALAHTA
jgi:gluconolactonase